MTTSAIDSAAPAIPIMESMSLMVTTALDTSSGMAFPACAISSCILSERLSRLSERAMTSSAISVLS